MTDKVKTPTAALVEDSNKEKVVTDSNGREIKFRTLRPSESMRLFSIIGPEDVYNQLIVVWSLHAAGVTQIGDLPISKPTTREQLDAVLDRLGQEGINALLTAK